MWTGSDRPGAEQHFFDRSELCMILPLKRVAFLTRLISSEIATAPEVKCPVYIVHGTNDEVISYSQAEDLVRNCQEGIAYPPYLVENGGHNNLEAGTGRLHNETCVRSQLITVHLHCFWILIPKCMVRECYPECTKWHTPSLSISAVISIIRIP